MFRRDECYSRTHHGIHHEIDREKARDDLRVLFAPGRPDLHVTMETDARAGCHFLPGVWLVGCMRLDLAGASKRYVMKN